MGRSIRVGTVLDLEIRIDYSWFLVFLLLVWSLSTGVFPVTYGFDARLSWMLGTVAALLLFFSVLVHEISHALVARAYGTEVSGITLFLLGGVAHIKSEPETPGAEFCIAAIGPVVSFLLGLLCLVGWWLTGGRVMLTHGALPGPVAALFNYLGVVNIALALFNLIPGFPLDGGRILRSAIWKVTGSLRKATCWASLAGQGFGWLLIGLGLFQVVNGSFSGFWLAFVGWFLHSAARASYQQQLLRGALNGVAVADVMSQEVPPVNAELRVRQFLEEYVLQYPHAFYPVVRDGEFVGIVATEDVQNLQRNLWGVTCVGVLAQMPEEERVVSEDVGAWDALARMIEQDAQRLLVIRDGRLKGIVSRDAIFRIVQRRRVNRV